MMRRSTPAAMRDSATRRIIGLPPTSTSAFGTSRVTAPRRVPSPAARIIASMSGPAGGPLPLRPLVVRTIPAALRSLQRSVSVFHFFHGHGSPDVVARPRRFLPVHEHHFDLRKLVPDVRRQPLREI